MFDLLRIVFKSSNLKTDREREKERNIERKTQRKKKKASKKEANAHEHRQDKDIQIYPNSIQDMSGMQEIENVRTWTKTEKELER